MLSNAAILVRNKKETETTDSRVAWGNHKKTFNGKQALSRNSGNHFGENRDTFGQISQVETSKAVSACTQRRGSKDHLETSDDIRLSVNYSNKRAREWHFTLDVSPVGTVVDASNSNKELLYTNSAENKHIAHYTVHCVQ